MNLQCIECEKSFSIQARQLGMRGRCPHCRSSVQMPASVDQIQARRTMAVTDPRLIQRTLLAAIVILFHVGALLLMANLPWYSSGQRPLEFEHHFVLQPPVEPRLASSTIPPLQTVPLASLNAESNDRVMELPTPVRRMIANQTLDQSSFGRFGVPMPREGPFDGVPEFIASAEGGLNAWDDFRFKENPLTPVETFDELLQRLGSDGLDIAIVFDSTASMNREIAQVKDGIQQMGETLFHLVPKTRISVCTYRDQGDQYVAKGLGLSSSITQVVTFLSDVVAEGGGDKSEAVTAGVEWVIENNKFSHRAKKVILIFGDAPPKSDQWLACQQLVSDFRFGQRGIVSTVTCHRRTKLKSFVEIAQLGGGESFLNSDETEIVQQLLVLVFGARYRHQLLPLLN